MGELDAMRQCFCLLWFRHNASISSSSGSSKDRSSRTDVNNSSSFDDVCSSLLDSSTAGYSPSHANIVEEFLYTRVVVAICCFGLLGNAVNLVVLSAKRYCNLLATFYVVQRYSPQSCNFQSAIRRGVRSGLCRSDILTAAERIEDMDDNLFERILWDKNHILHALLPDRRRSLELSLIHI